MLVLYLLASKSFDHSKRKEANLRYRWNISSPLDELTLFAENKNIVGLYFEDHQPAPRDTEGRKDQGPFRDLISQLEQYFAGDRFEFSLPLAFCGTDFQQQVWHGISQVPFAGTKTYGDLARDCSRPKASRAVGAAVGRNPISIVNPCHRILGANGRITGFAGGVARKQWLLDHEKRLAPQSVSGAGLSVE